MRKIRYYLFLIFFGLCSSAFAQSGLLNYYPFNNSCLDTAGNPAKNCTLVGGTTFATGQVNQAISFANTNFFSNTDYALLPNGSPDVAGDRSIAFGVKFNNFNDPCCQVMFIFGSNNDAVVPGYLDSHQNLLVTSVDHQAASSQETTGVTFTAGTWYRIVVTKSFGQIQKIYVNGVDRTTPSTLVSNGAFGTNADASTGWPIGSSCQFGPSTCEHGLNGLLDEVKTFDHQFSQSEVNTDYATWQAGGSGDKVPPVVSSCSGINPTPNSISWRCSATDNISTVFSVQVKIKVTGGSYGAYGPAISSTSPATITSQPLSSSTSYTATMNFCDEVGNCTESSEIVQSTSAPSGGGNTFYISPSGNDGNAGTTGSPWKTFGKAFSTMVGSDTLLLKDGTYNASAGTGYPLYYKSRGYPCGTSGHYITIKAEHELQASIIHEEDQGRPLDFAFPLVIAGNGISDQCGFIWVEGLYIKEIDLANGGNGTFYMGFADHLVVRRNIVNGVNKNNNSMLFYGKNLTNSLIEENEGYDYKRHGIFLGDGIPQWSTGNEVRRNYLQSRNASGGSDPTDVTPGRGDVCLINYPGSNNIFENNICENVGDIGGAISASSTSGGNQFLGNLGYDIFNGYSDSSQDPFSQNPDPTFGCNVFQNNIPNGCWPNNTTWRDNIAVATATVGSSCFQNNSGTNAQWDHNTCDNGVNHPNFSWYSHQHPYFNYSPTPTNFAMSIFSTNSLYLNTPVGYLDLASTANWSLDYAGLYNSPLSLNDSANIVPPIPASDPHIGAHNVTLSSNEMGSCKLWVPSSATHLKGAGSGGSDIGATILYAYEGSVLTNKPLWDLTTGQPTWQLPILTGVNDNCAISACGIAGRFNINQNGCGFPASYSSGVFASLSLTPTSGASGSTRTFTISTANASTCSIDNGVGSVNCNGSTHPTVTPTVTTTYCLTAVGSATVTSCATATVVSANITASLSANPSTINQGNSSTLNVTTTNSPSSCSIDHSVGTVNCDGSSPPSVSPSSTTTYTLTATGTGGPVTSQATVTVISGPNVAITQFSFSPTTIAQGSSSNLTWSVANSTSQSIDNGIGSVGATNPNGFLTGSSLAPGKYTYTITAQGTGGPVTSQATLQVTAVTTAVATLSVGSQIKVGAGGSISLGFTGAGLPPPPPQPPPGGPAYQWTFNEGQGSTTSDAVAGDTGTLNNGVTWVAGQQSTTAVKFTRQGAGYILLDSVPVTTGNATVTFWWTPITTDASQVAIFFPTSNADGITIGYYVTNQTILASAADNSTVSSKESSVTVSAATKYFIAVTKSSGQIQKIYINAVDRTALGTTAWGVRGIISAIGSSYLEQGPVAFSDTVIDNVTVYAKQLSASEIMNAYTTEQ